MTIHSSHPFDQPELPRDWVRQLRGRLSGAVSLWTAGVGTAPRDRAGLTVSSVMVAEGEPARVLALLDPLADLLDLLLDSETAVVQLLRPRDTELAEAFAGRIPAPGGPFRLGGWEATPWGPRLVTAPVWAGVRLEREPSEVGYSQLVQCVIEELQVGDGEVLTHHRGEYGAG